jgi:hypothetical protein
MTVRCRKTKLQKQRSGRKNGKEYPKYVIVLPTEIIDQLQWAKGDQLIPSTDGKILKIRKAR